MTYTAAEKILAASAIRAALPGLRIRPSQAWVQCEQGADFNIFGVTVLVNGQWARAKYSSFTQGATAAAHLLHTNPVYAPIIASLSGSDADQATAICTSPWHLGPTGLRNAGGIDRYYASVFADFGFKLVQLPSGKWEMSDTQAKPPVKPPVTPPQPPKPTANGGTMGTGNAYVDSLTGNIETNERYKMNLVRAGVTDPARYTPYDDHIAIFVGRLAALAAAGSPDAAAAETLPANPPSTGPVSHAQVDHAVALFNKAVIAAGGSLDGQSGPAPTGTLALDIATRLGIVREMAQYGTFGTPESPAVPGVDWSAYTHLNGVGAGSSITWQAWVNGVKVAEALGGPSDVGGQDPVAWAQAQGVTFV